jgi:predicted DNA-binding protein with PD1-like motif
MTENFELLACSGAISQQHTHHHIVKAFTIAAVVEILVKVACIFEYTKFFVEIGEKLLASVVPMH